jgi:hypothetical protein
MRRLATVAAAALAATAAALAVAPRDDAGAADPQAIVLKVGDRVTVDGQPLGCRVARQGGHAVVDCRRGGPLAGTYGTVISAHRALVVRYRSNSVAKVVYSAEHGGAAVRCS